MPATMPQLTRREFFRVGGVGVAGYHLLPMLAPRNVRAASKAEPRGGADVTILLFLSGGASQTDTFDVREGQWTPPDFDIRTVTPGLRMPVGLLPSLSRQTDKYCIVRSIEAWEIDHGRGSYYVQAGRLLSPARIKEIPSVGAVVAHETASRRKESDYLPPFMAMNVVTSPGMQLVGNGVLPASCGPMALFSTDPPPFLVPEQERDRFGRRLEMLKDLDAGWRREDSGRGQLFREIDGKYQGAYPLLSNPRVSEVFKIASDEHQRYGSSALGDACVLARNVVQEDAGNRFILISHGGWDLHRNAYDKTAKVNQYTLCRELDSALGSLLEDLASRTDERQRPLLDKALVVCMGEFGRTTGSLSTQNGRDHYRHASSAVLAGGGVKGGKVLGVTNETGEKIVDSGWSQKRSIYPEDVLLSIYSAMGVDWTKKITQTLSGRPFEYIENISPIGYMQFSEVSELFS